MPKATTASQTTVTNLGRQINLISGINGVSAGGQAVYNVPNNRRYHRKTIKCTGISFAGGTGLTATAVTGSGTALKVDVTVTPAGLVNTIVQHSGSAGSGFTTGDTITFTDPNYPTGYASGFVGTVTASSGAVTAIAITTNGVVGPLQPALVISSVTVKINGVVMRDISVAQTLAIISANPFNKNYALGAGEFPILYTEPWRNVLQKNDVTSWDTFGQPNFEIDFGIQSSVSQPGLNGTMEFDYRRNQRTGSNGVVTPFLQPVKYKAFSQAIPGGSGAGASFDWTTLPINFPIARMWFVGSSPGNITRLEVYQDGNKVLESLVPEINEMYGEYGFNIVGAGWDTAFISDPDQRLGKALKVSNNMIVRIYSTASQNVTCVMEILPGNYK